MKTTIPDALKALGDLSWMAEWFSGQDHEALAKDVWRFIQRFDDSLPEQPDWYLGEEGPLAGPEDLLRATEKPSYAEGVRSVDHPVHPDSAKSWSAWLATIIGDRTVSVEVTWSRSGLITDNSVVFGLEGSDDAAGRELLDLAFEVAIATLPVAWASTTTPSLRDYVDFPPRWSPRIGWRTWLTGLDPSAMTDTGATNVRAMSGGVDFTASPERIATVQQSMLDRGLLRCQDPARPEFTTTLPAPDPVFREYITGVAPAADGSVPTYVVDDPRGQPVPFHGHLWRESDQGPVEVFLTTLGGYGPLLRENPLARLALQNAWAHQAMEQRDVVPSAARNEWHLDDQSTYDALQQALEPQNSNIIIYLHPRPGTNIATSQRSG